LSPPADSLFERLDRALHADRFHLFDQLRRAFLSEEERAFAVLQLEYLLRIDAPGDAWNQRADAFLTRYPASRFAAYLRTIRPKAAEPGRSGVSVGLALVNATWRDELERTLRPLWGGEFAAAWWYRRWQVGGRFLIGGSRLERDIEEKGFVWPENDPVTCFGLEAELGFDVVRVGKVRFTPLLGAGFAALTPPGDDEEEDDPNPDYYSNFEFFNASVSAGLQADVGLGRLDDPEEGLAGGSSHGLRLRVGYRWLYFGAQNELLPGDMFFFAVGYQLFARQAGK
jgi:hypothetical protein